MRAAVARTVATAGRTVVFSGATVFVVLGAMTFFQQYFLRSFGYAGMAATLTAVLAALTGLPAALSLLGTRVDRFRVLRRDLTPRDEGVWSTISRFVMRRPVPVLVATLAVLGDPRRPGARGGLLAGRRPGAAGRRARRPSPTASSRSASPATRARPSRSSLPPGADDAATARLRRAALAHRARDVGDLGPGRLRRRSAAGADPRAATMRVASGRSGSPSSPTCRPWARRGRELVERVRATPAPVGGVLVGGAAARFRDGQAAIGSRGVLALAWVALATLVLLFLFTGSVVIAVKAVLLNLLSLAAMLGAVVWVFQEGHAQWLVGSFTRTGTVDTAMAVLVAITAFALSMDYEVFLLSRIVEEHRRGRRRPRPSPSGCSARAASSRRPPSCWPWCSRPS